MRWRYDKGNRDYEWDIFDFGIWCGMMIKMGISLYLCERNTHFIFSFLCKNE